MKVVVNIGKQKEVYDDSPIKHKSISDLIKEDRWVFLVWVVYKEGLSPEIFEVRSRLTDAMNDVRNLTNQNEVHVAWWATHKVR